MPEFKDQALLDFTARTAGGVVPNLRAGGSNGVNAKMKVNHVCASH